MAYTIRPEGPVRAFDSAVGTTTRMLVNPTAACPPTRPPTAQPSATQLDAMVELADLTRARNDLARTFPRAAVADVPIRSPMLWSLRRFESGKILPCIPFRVTRMKCYLAGKGSDDGCEVGVGKTVLVFCPGGGVVDSVLAFSAGRAV